MKNNNAENTVKKVRIYQIEDINSEYIFKRYNFVKKQGLSAPPADLYNVFFDGRLETDNLEDIYRIFNINPPPAHKGSLLSVSDIIELYDDNSSSFFYCDTVGYKEIQFEPVKIRCILLTQNERDLINFQLFPTLMEAKEIMKAELLEKLGGSFDNYDEGEDYDFYDISAWSNPGSNWDWTIIRLMINKDLNVKTDFISKT